MANYNGLERKPWRADFAYTANGEHRVPCRKENSNTSWAHKAQGKRRPAKRRTYGALSLAPSLTATYTFTNHKAV